MKHVMIDIETLGLHANCVILCIGAVQFDLDSGNIGEKYRRTVDIEDQIKRGRTITADTLQFWMNQKRETFESCLRAPVPLEAALYDLGEFLYDHDIKFVWSNGINFDLGILKHAFNSIPYPLPWSYKDERDYKTIRELFAPPVEAYLETEKHNAIADCKYQIVYLCETWRKFQKRDTIQIGYPTKK
jgi:exodeoxyribonuclease VIII